MSRESFADQRVVIIGGSAGIGLALARMLAAEGAEVVIAGRSRDRLEKAHQAIGLPVRSLVVDATSDSSLNGFWRAVGVCDHLVSTVHHNMPVVGFKDSEIKAARLAFETKFWAQYLVARFGAVHVRRGGSIVLTSGIAAQRSYPGFAAVAAMNAAVEAMVRVLAVELAPIRINAVSPGFVGDPEDDERTEMVAKLVPRLPARRMGTAEEMAEAYRYLLRCGYANGSVVVADGGAYCG